MCVTNIATKSKFHIHSHVGFKANDKVIIDLRQYIQQVIVNIQLKVTLNCRQIFNLYFKSA